MPSTAGGAVGTAGGDGGDGAADGAGKEIVFHSWHKTLRLS